MKDLFEQALALYLAILLLASLIGFLARVGSPENCEARYADYIFLGMPKLVCKVEK
jgi:hypothetical protein